MSRDAQEQAEEEALRDTPGIVVRNPGDFQKVRVNK